MKLADLIRIQFLHDWRVENKDFCDKCVVGMPQYRDDNVMTITTLSASLYPQLIRKLIGSSLFATSSLAGKHRIPILTQQDPYQQDEKPSSPRREAYDKITYRPTKYELEMCPPLSLPPSPTQPLDSTHVKKLKPTLSTAEKKLWAESVSKARFYFEWGIGATTTEAIMNLQVPKVSR